MTINNGWRPAAALSRLRERARIMAQIRHFFAQRCVLEVDTPILGAFTASDPQLSSLTTRLTAYVGMVTDVYYLQTSPESAMKRLLAAGSGPVYQISKVFRNDEFGSYHNPEFTLLEWYQPAYSHHDLMDEVAVLLVNLGIGRNINRISYQDLFEHHVGLNPHAACENSLRTCATEHGIEVTSAVDQGDKDQWLELLMTHVIAPKLDLEGEATFVFDYPASQAALACVNNETPPVAERFEFYYGGIELANGYHELTDAVEQQRRFAQDNDIRLQRGLPAIAPDSRLIAALEAGLPACAGVAIGIDRLIMCLLGCDTLNDVLAFPMDRV